MHGTCLAKEVRVGGLEVKGKSMSKKWKCQNAQLTEGMAKSLGRLGLGPGADQGSGLETGFGLITMGLLCHLSSLC